MHVFTLIVKFDDFISIEKVAKYCDNVHGRLFTLFCIHVHLYFIEPVLNNGYLNAISF